MTLLSMCMNLMQEQIVEKVSWVAAELGMNGDGNDEEVVKLSREVLDIVIFSSVIIDTLYHIAGASNYNPS